MGPDRRRPILLGVFVALVAFVVYRMWPASAIAPLPSSNGRTSTAANPARRSTPASVTALDVHLEELAAERPKPTETDRNLFRFKPPPPPSPAPRGAQAPPPVVPSGPPQPPPPPPITLKFIGLIGPTAHLPKMAVLSDGRGTPVYGKEGDIILGQYRIVRIGAESIEMSYLDGRGRTTIRLSGS